MICANCKSSIEDDSLFCDQCGKEIFICPACGKPGKGKNCVEDGSKLFSPRQKSLTNNNTSLSPKTVNSLIPLLKLVNHREKIDIEINDGDIIGSSTGEHVEVFCKYKQVSGIHARFVFDKDNGWMVTDIGSAGKGSTNGTAVNSLPVWQNVSKLISNKPVKVLNNSFLLIANIEFEVKVILPKQLTPNTTQPETQTGTQRL
jgi:hypothetical protein